MAASPQVTRVLFPPETFPSFEQRVSNHDKNIRRKLPVARQFGGILSTSGGSQSILLLQPEAIQRHKRKRTLARMSGVVTTHPTLMGFPTNLTTRVPSQARATSKIEKRRPSKAINNQSAKLSSLEAVVPTKPARRQRSLKPGVDQNATTSVLVTIGPNKNVLRGDNVTTSSGILGTIEANTAVRGNQSKLQISTKPNADADGASILMNLSGKENPQITASQVLVNAPAISGLTGFVDNIPQHRSKDAHPGNHRVKRPTQKSRTRKRKAKEMVTTTSQSILLCSAKPTDVRLKAKTILSSLVMGAAPRSRTVNTVVQSTNTIRRKAIFNPPRTLQQDLLTKSTTSIQNPPTSSTSRGSTLEKNKPAWLTLEVSARHATTTTTTTTTATNLTKKVDKSRDGKRTDNQHGSIHASLDVFIPPSIDLKAKEAKQSKKTIIKAGAPNDESCLVAALAAKKAPKRNETREQSVVDGKSSNASKSKNQKAATKNTGHGASSLELCHPLARTKKTQDATTCFSSLVVATKAAPNQPSQYPKKKAGSKGTGTSSAESTTPPSKIVTSSSRTGRRRVKPARYSDEFQNTPHHVTPATISKDDHLSPDGTQTGEMGEVDGRRSRRPPIRFSDEYVKENGSDGTSPPVSAKGKAGSRKKEKTGSLQSSRGRDKKHSKSSGSNSRKKHKKARRSGSNNAKAVEKRSAKRVSGKTRKLSLPPPQAAEIIVLSSDSGSDDEEDGRLHHKGGVRRVTRKKAAPTKRPDSIKIIDFDDGTSSDEDEESSIGSFSVSPPNEIDVITANASKLLEMRTVRRRLVCYDQVEIAKNNEVLLAPGNCKPPLFLSIVDENTTDERCQSTVASMPLTSPMQESHAGSCCYSDLEFSSATTCLFRMQMNKAPIMTPVEESRLVPRYKNGSAAGAGAPTQQPPRKKHRLGLSTKLRNVATTPKIVEPEQVDVAWSVEDIAALKIAYKNAHALSCSFWDDIAEKVEGKTALQCQKKWLALLKTPPRKANPKKKAPLTVTEGEDDIFLSTPLRGGTNEFDQANEGKNADEGTGFPSFDIGSPIAFEQKQSEISSINDEDNLDTLDFRFKPGYVSYMRTTKTDIRRSQFRHPKAKFKKVKNTISEHVGEGDVAMKGNLSPGGTLRVQNFSAEPDDDMFFRGDESDCDDDGEDCLFS